MASLLNSTEYISKISDYDSNLLQGLQETRMEIEALEKQQEEELAQIKALKEELEGQETELNTLLDEKASYIMSLNANIEYTEEVIRDRKTVLLRSRLPWKKSRHRFVRRRQKRKHGVSRQLPAEAAVLMAAAPMAAALIAEAMTFRSGPIQGHPPVDGFGRVIPHI